MSGSNIWAIDRVAAFNLSMALGERLNEDQIATIAKHMSYHRRGMIDLMVSRIRLYLLDRIGAMISDHGHYRGAEWSAGCLSAEEVVRAQITPENLALCPSTIASKGQILRKMVGAAREKISRNSIVVRAEGSLNSV